VQRAALSALLLAVLFSLSACTDSSAPQTFTTENYPRLLSDWNMMTVRDKQLILHQAVTAYDLATPLFSDYALKLRTVWLPEGKMAAWQPEGSVDFPVGTVITKTFYYPQDPLSAEITGVLKSERSSLGFDGTSLKLDQVRLLETRLLVHQPEGWEAIPYVWNDDQSDATLQIAGAVMRLQMRDEPLNATNTEGSDFFNTDVVNFAYVVPNRNECASCHVLDQNKSDMSPIGPSIRNLNKLYSYSADGPANQLELWQQTGILAALPAELATMHAATWQPGAFDNLEARARTYLDVNCGHCHQPGGSGDTSGLFLHAAEKSATRLGVCKPPVAAGRGTGGHRFSIVPGDPDSSILSYRIQSNEIGVLMPEVGRSLTHESGSQLIATWIREMPGDCD
jgi:uncharacterized repeat protein (TIGR03806 family)